MLNMRTWRSINVCQYSRQELHRTRNSSWINHEVTRSYWTKFLGMAHARAGFLHRLPFWTHFLFPERLCGIRHCVACGFVDGWCFQVSHIKYVLVMKISIDDRRSYWRQIWMLMMLYRSYHRCCDHLFWMLNFMLLRWFGIVDGILIEVILSILNCRCWYLILTRLAILKNAVTCTCLWERGAVSSG